MLGKIKGVVDNLVFLLVICLTYAKFAINAEVSVLLAGAATAAERTACCEAGSRRQDSGAEAAVAYLCRGRCAPKQKKESTGRGCLA